MQKINKLVNTFSNALKTIVHISTFYMAFGYLSWLPEGWLCFDTVLWREVINIIISSVKRKHDTVNINSLLKL